MPLLSHATHAALAQRFAAKRWSIGRTIGRPSLTQASVVIGGGCAARERRWKGLKPDGGTLSASLSRRRGRRDGET